MELLEPYSQEVLAKQHRMSNGLCFAVLSLNRPKNLNALSMTMLRHLHHYLSLWQDDPTVAFVVLQSTTERSFCAGGDVRALREDVLSERYDQVGAFFDLEYTVDEMIHRYAKPVVAFGLGMVIGGGAGLFVGASHRIMNEHSLFSMPEVSIGLFPDVGASWFFNRIPQWLGRFLALTASPVTAGDALHMGLCDYVLHPSHPPSFWFEEWSACTLRYSSDDHLAWKEYLSDGFELCALDQPPGHFEHVWHWMRMVGRQPSLDRFIKKLHMLYRHSPILEAACVRLRQASPRSLQATWDLLEQQRFASLHNCFQQERQLAYQLCLHGDFCEGVRAKLVDRDDQANWQAP